MEEVIGLRGTPGHGSLMEWGVTYRELALADQGLIDWAALRTAITPSQPWTLVYYPLSCHPPPPLQLSMPSIPCCSTVPW